MLVVTLLWNIFNRFNVFGLAPLQTFTYDREDTIQYTHTISLFKLRSPKKITNSSSEVS